MYEIHTMNTIVFIAMNTIALILESTQLIEYSHHLIIYEFIHMHMSNKRPLGGHNLIKKFKTRLKNPTISSFFKLY